MSIRTYTADGNGKIFDASQRYTSSGSHSIQASNNITAIKFTKSAVDVSFGDDPNAASQASLYTSISFGSNVTSIPWRSCYKFSNLQSAACAGNKISSIGPEAFFMCKSLLSFKMTDSMLSVGSSAFEECAKLASFSFPSKAVSIGSRAFYNSGLTSLNVIAGDVIEDKAFAKCSSLKNASINGGLATEMFADCTSLQHVSLQKDVSSIPAKCFMNCSSLKNVSFKNIKAVTSIEDYAFSGCTSLETSFIDQTSASQLGSSVFFGTNILSVVLPATVKSVSQVSNAFLAGSNVTLLKFLGMTAQEMESHRTEFTSFGADMNSIVIESSDGKKYKVDNTGLVISSGSGGSASKASRGVYVISVAISNNVAGAPLKGMYLDTGRFINLVNLAYSDSPQSILGVTRLNDQGTNNSDGVGTIANLETAFDKAVNTGADFIIFHFSDHGHEMTKTQDGTLSMYGGRYEYNRLFAQLQKFKYAFSLLCCCRPMSARTQFEPGPNNTSALFWAGGTQAQDTKMIEGVGHEFMTRLCQKFNKSYTWEQQWNAIKANIGNRKPTEWIYGDFPMTDKVFRVDS